MRQARVHANRHSLPAGGSAMFCPSGSIWTFPSGRAACRQFGAAATPLTLGCAHRNATLALKALLSVWILSVPLWAQSNFASLSGTIEDPQKRPVPQARVQLKSTATGFVR